MKKHAVNLTAGRKDEEFTTETFKEYLIDGFDRFFCSHIPVESIQEMPQYYMYLFGIVAYLISFFLFFVFIYSSYTSAIEQPFMSLQNGVLCNEIPITVTQTLMADINGNWLGQPDFEYQNFAYEIQLSLFDGTSNNFASAMDQIYNEISEVGAKSLNRNLATNIIYWMNYLLEVPVAGSIVLFSFSGIPNVVYNLKYFHGQVSCELADCPMTSISTYDMSNSLIESEYNYSQFARELACYTAVNPYSLGYVPSIDGDLLKFELDVQAFQLALGVNLGVLPIDQLLLVPGSNMTLAYGTISLNVGAYYSFRTPFMQQIYCITNVTGISGTFSTTSILFSLTHTGAVCVVNVGDVYGLPVFNSWGAEPDEPVYCDCETSAGHSSACETFDFISGVVFYNSPISTEINNATAFKELLKVELAGLVGLLNKTKTYSTLNRDAYNASFASSYSIINNNKDPNSIYKSSKWRKEAYSFCEIANPFTNTSVGSRLPNLMTCSLITFNSFDPVTRSVSEYKYQLRRGSCQDSFSSSNATWQKMIANAPIQFTQDYYECTYGYETAMINAIGIAQGNVQVVLPALVFASLPLIFIFLRLIGQVPPKEEYNEREKDDVIGAWATQLLRIRDGKTRGLRAKGVLLTLGKELIRAAREEGGYPDSDDSDDEDDARSSKGSTSAGESRESVMSSASKVKQAKKPIVFHRHKFDVFTRNIREQEMKANQQKGSGISSRNSFAMLRRSDASSRQNPAALATAYGMWSKAYGGGHNASGKPRDSRISRSVSGMSMMSEDNSSSRAVSKDLSMVIMGTFDTDIKVLNSPEMNPEIDFKKEGKAPIGVIELEAIIEMLTSKLQESIAKKANDFTPSRETEAYKEAKVCAAKLKRANVEDMLRREDCGSQLFLQLSNSLTLHASIALGCEMRDISLYYIDSVGYDIGGRVYTPKHFMDLCTAGGMH